MNYTPQQIQEMRKAVRYLHGNCYYPPGREDLGRTWNYNRDWYEAENDYTEQLLQTYILANCDPAELIALWKTRNRIWNQAWDTHEAEQECKRQEAAVEQARKRVERESLSLWQQIKKAWRE